MRIMTEKTKTYDAPVSYASQNVTGAPQIAILNTLGRCARHMSDM